MRIRKFLALVGAVTIFFGCLFIYQLTDHTLYLQDDASRQFQAKNSAHKGEKTGDNEINKNVIETEKVQMDNNEGKFSFLKNIDNNPRLIAKGYCKNITKIASSDIQMLDVYKDLKFDNIDGGVWKQGWNIETTSNRWNSQNKLKVIIVPHSHNDPGWLKTFEDYYITETRNILNNLLRKLSTDERKKFIWAEISFLSLWWDELSQEDQEKVTRLIHDKQLEIVTGGWVMNDEANSHYYSIITQLTEGHQWMYSNFQKTPRNAWTIDPFGESPVMPYIFKKMGLENLVIQRVHYSVKKYLAKTRNLEFRWKQFWGNVGFMEYPDHDEGGETCLMTHMMPFYSYDIPHTCGPDPKICCQFDFKRLPGNGVSCPWKESPKPIHAKNVAARAQMLLDQYRKKAELYRTNAILVPLGDDFRYQSSAEWDGQFENYYKIIDYINHNPAMYANIKFGTLNDFFDALLEEAPVEEFPTLSGDFFTYADRDDHYWSGYYTSRPFYKKMDRILIGLHRAAEIIYALSWSYNKSLSTDWLLSPQTGFAKMLRDARRSLSLFQHHDGVTGTARDNVMQDYAKKMLEAIHYSQHIIQQCVHFLLSPVEEVYKSNPEEVYFDFDDHRRNIHTLPERKLLIFKEGETKRLVIYNSLTVTRREVVSIQVSVPDSEYYPNIQILDSNQKEIETQTSPVFAQGSIMDENRYEVYFIVEVPPLSLSSFTIAPQMSKLESNSLSKVSLYNVPGPLITSKGFEDTENLDSSEFSIESRFAHVTFSENGLIKTITCKETMTYMLLRLEFIRYLARSGKERSGAYLFLPEGEADTISTSAPLIRTYKGPIYSRVEVFLPNVKHTVTLYDESGLETCGVNIENLVDIKDENNYELAMRITSHVLNKDVFYTDLNGFQMIERKRFAKIPIQGNFYPMPTAAYIEDEKSRITIVSGQPLGVSSLKQGQLEVLQDRRLKQDDNRGLGQGVLDNKPTANVFRILIEKRLGTCQSYPGLLSPNAHFALQDLLYPVIKLLWRPESPCTLSNSFNTIKKELSFDTHLVVARTMDEETKPLAGFAFFRHHLDSCFFDPTKTRIFDGVINIDTILTDHFRGPVRKSVLSFTKQDDFLERKSNETLCPMDFFSVVISR